MNRLVKFIGVGLVLVAVFTLYQTKATAINETKNYVTKKETAEAIGRAILMENFPGSVRFDTELNVIEEEYVWLISVVPKKQNYFLSEEEISHLEEVSPNAGKYRPGDGPLIYGILSGGGLSIIFKKSDCQIVEIIVAD